MLTNKSDDFACSYFKIKVQILGMVAALSPERKRTIFVVEVVQTGDNLGKVVKFYFYFFKIINFL